MSGTITGLSVQKRDPNRLNIELDGEFAFGLNRLTAAWLQVGQLLSDKDIKKLQTEDENEKVYKAALHLLGHRARSSTEMVSRLLQKGFPREQVEPIINKLIANGMLNDQEYAESYARDRAAMHPRSQRLITLELRKKGITGEEIETILEDLPDDDQLALQAAKKVMNRWSTTDKKSFENKCAGYLARKGFGYGTISTVMSIIWQEVQQINEK